MQENERQKNIVWQIWLLNCAISDQLNCTPLSSITIIYCKVLSVDLSGEKTEKSLTIIIAVVKLILINNSKACSLNVKTMLFHSTVSRSIPDNLSQK